MSVFRHYSQEGCRFECLLSHGRRSCNCTPWNYPFSEGEDVRVCDLYGNFCFEQMMRNTTGADCKRCIPDCESIQYTFAESSRPIDLVCGDLFLLFSMFAHCIS